MGDRIYSLNATLVSEREMWVNAIEMSRQTANQQKKSKAGLSKNITLILNIFDKEVLLICLNVISRVLKS